MDILKRVLFCFMIFGLIGGAILRVDTGQSIAVTFLDVGVGLFVIISLVLQLFQKRKISFAIEKYVLYFLGLGVFSLLFQVSHFNWYQLFVATLYVLRFLLYTVGISIAIQLMDTRWKMKIPFILFLSGVSIAILGLVQYAYYPSLRNLYYAGWDVHLYRIFSTFLDPNFAGLFFVMSIFLGVVLLRKAKKRNHKVILGLGILTLLIALVLTYSRGAYVAGIIGLVFLFWRKGYKKFIVIILGIAVAGVMLLEIFGPKSEGTKLLRTVSVRNRIESIQTVTKIIQKNVLFGVGFDAYRYAQQKEGFLVTEIDTTHSGAGTDNSFLFVTATTGVVGLALYLLMTYKLVTFVKRKSVVHEALFAGYIALIVGSIFVNALFYPFLLTWVWILVGLTFTHTGSLRT